MRQPFFSELYRLEDCRGSVVGGRERSAHLGRSRSILNSGTAVLGSHTHVSMSLQSSRSNFHVNSLLVTDLFDEHGRKTKSVLLPNSPNGFGDDKLCESSHTGCQPMFLFRLFVPKTCWLRVGPENFVRNGTPCNHRGLAAKSVSNSSSTRMLALPEGTNCYANTKHAAKTLSATLALCILCFPKCYVLSNMLALCKTQSAKRFVLNGQNHMFIHFFVIFWTVEIK